MPLPCRCACIPLRFLVCLLCYLMITVCYYQRVTFYQASDEVIFTITKNRTLYSDCPFVVTNSNHTFLGVVKDNTEYLWEEHQQKTTRRSFFIGYALAMIPAGVLADVFGGKGVAGWGVAISTIVALLHDKVIHYGYTYVVVCRFIQGVGQGMMWPGVMVIIAHWAPITERSIFVGISQSGYFAGRVLTYTIPLFVPALRNSSHAKLYLGGFFGVIVCILWYVMISNDPSRSRRIRAKERDMILSQTEGIERPRFLKPIVPCDMLRSIEFLSLVLFFSGCAWLYGEMHNTVVIYLTEFIHLPKRLAINCYILAIAAGILPPVIFGAFSDWLINVQAMSRTANRQMFGFLGHFLIIPFLFTILTARCDGTVVAAMYTCIYFFVALSYGSSNANCIDLSPQHAGVTYGIMHFLSVFTTFFSMEMFEMLRDKEDPHKFWILYIINTLVFLTFSLPYLLIGSAEIQPWNYSRSVVSSSTTPQPPEPERLSQ
ncbi:hypothetical protein J6590_068559 [Homalodisca vitripennis]|nr:hypothetical protein J6590_068559 [Homalodisca vitripennis]